MSDPALLLQKYWGHTAFRPLQEDIINSVLDGRDTLAILPTGGGKSICFQVPALARDGLCLVISPLIALMKDQVDGLKKRGIPALLIHSGMKKADVIQTLKNSMQDYFKFLYVSPERLETSLFREYLPAMNVNLLAVDEAHCISQWGYDFRPSYLRIADLRQELPGVPVLALTASATPEVQEDICERLQFPQKNIFRQPFERSNLSYSVLTADAKQTKLVDIIQKVPGTAIVYCKSRKRTHEISRLLQMHGVSSHSYHAGLKGEERAQRQKDWIDNKVRVMVCTNAFGMGIDKPDVRLVVHADTPDCLENYYQEAGRAGRDGRKSYVVLLHNEADIETLSQLHTVRFPTLEQIRKVYGALGNFLQLPSYTGEYKSFNFRFDEFIRNFSLDSQEALYSLKALEQDGWIDFNEQSFTPSTLVFTTGKNGLNEFHKSHPEHEHLLTTLLRTYEGIFDFPAFISELFIARLLKKQAIDIQLQLQTIASFGIIRYTPQNELPQIIFRKHRVPAQDLIFREAPYEQRRQNFIRRVQTMIDYIRTTGCRSRFINRYFGDAAARDCGACDNCLAKKRKTLTPDEFEKIAALITGQLAQKPRTLPDLLKETTGLKKEKAWQVIEFLQAEKKIAANEEGLLYLR